MKKIIMLMLFFIILISSVYALDLSDYPSFFVKGNKLDVVIVVGDKAPSSDVLAQTQIALSLAQFGNALGVSKLASEIEYEEQNIISIGSPCYNRITAQIMNNPVPCDKDLTEGKAFIRMYQNNNNVQIVIAGYNSEATREVANILRDYQDYSLKGHEYIINLETFEETEEKSTDIESEESKIENKIKEEKEKIREESKKIEESPKKNIIEIKPTESKEPKEFNIIKKIINWFRNLFGIK